MRELKDHHVSGVPTTVRVFPEGDAPPNSASSVYRLALGQPGQETGKEVMLKFQVGPTTTGVNGIINEALLVVVIDRLEQFQEGKFKCRENAIALTHIQTALLWLNERKRERLERGVVDADKP